MKQELKIIEMDKIEKSLKRELRRSLVVPSIWLRSKNRSIRNSDTTELDKWDKIRREDSRFDLSQYEGGRKKFYQK